MYLPPVADKHSMKIYVSVDVLHIYVFQEPIKIFLTILIIDFKTTFHITIIFKIMIESFPHNTHAYIANSSHSLPALFRTKYFVLIITNIYSYFCTFIFASSYMLFIIFLRESEIVFSIHASISSLSTMSVLAPMITFIRESASL